MTATSAARRERPLRAARSRLAPSGPWGGEALALDGVSRFAERLYVNQPVQSVAGRERLGIVRARCCAIRRSRSLVTPT